MFFGKYLSVIPVADFGPLMKGNVSTVMAGEGNKIISLINYMYVDKEILPW